MSGLFGDDELKNEPLHDKTQSVFKPRALTSKEYLSALEKSALRQMKRAILLLMALATNLK